jgi:hypothetical protein
VRIHKLLLEAHGKERRCTYRCKLAVDVLDEVGAELCEDLEIVSTHAPKLRTSACSYLALTGVSRWLYDMLKPRYLPDI